jgi:hypothetical protein
MVKLRGNAKPSAEYGATIMDNLEIVFYVDRQRHRPVTTDRPPETVKGLAKALSRLTNSPVQTGDAFNQRRIVTNIETQPIVTREVSLPLEQLPEDLRRIAYEMRARGESEPRLIGESVRVTVRDSDGNERTYNSLDELPVELRTDYEQAIRSARTDR